MEINSISNSISSVRLNKRATSTNPFEKNSFKGRTFKGSVLPFADVFQAIKPVTAPKPNKVKMIASSVIGAVVDFKTRLTQPIALFASKVRERIAQGVDSVRHGIESAKHAGSTIKAMGKNMQGRISQVFDFHKPDPEPVVPGVKILDLKHISPKAAVKDLKATWIAENEKISKESGKAVA